MKDLISKELEKNTNITNSKEYYLEMIKLLLNHIELKRDTFASIMINNKNSITMDILYDVIDKDIIKQIKINNDHQATLVPIDIISRFYLGAVISICTEWIVSKKYTKEEILKYFELLINDNI